MQKWSDDNDISMQLTHSEGKSVAAERFVITVKGAIYKKMRANNSKFYLGFLNKLVDEYNNFYRHSIDKKPINADYSAFTEEIESSHKAAKFKVGDRVSITKFKNIFSKRYTENWSKEIPVINSLLKTNPWTYKIKKISGEKITGSFYEKN